jgi:hypothetical protein
MKASIVLSIACAAMLLSLGVAQAQSPNPPGIRLDHYHCYRVSPVTRFRPLRVRLVDQFGRLQPTVVREQFLCAPVEKNGEPIKDKEDHLVCYSVTGGRNAGKRVEIINQFGKAVLQVGGTVTFCVPSLKKVLN